MNVSKLSDVALNRAMIWLYAKNRFIDREYKVADVIANLRWYREVNYLTDYNLTMPLAVENELFTESLHNMELKGLAGTMNGDTTAHCTTLLRAICEVLVMIALEKQK